MPFKEMLKPWPISKYTVITSTFKHALPWRLDTCIQTLQNQNFSLYVKSLGSHAIILTYLFRFNICWNGENCDMVFYETWPWEPVSAQNFLLHFYEYQHDFIGPANCLHLWKGWDIFTHFFGKTFLHIRALFGRKEVLQAWPRTSEVQSQP